MSSTRPVSSLPSSAATAGPARFTPGVHGGLIVGIVLVALVILAAVVSLVWTPHDPYATNAAIRLAGPSSSHLLGTDPLGRDVLSQTMVGARITLYVGLVSVGIGLVVGVPAGIWAAMRGGWVSTVFMTGSDILLAFPGLLLAIVLGAAFGASTTTAMVALGIASIPAFARVARSGALRVLSQDYVLAARVANRSGWAIARDHVLPNIAGMVIVQASVSYALAVLAEAGLSFMGLGTAPPTPSWGRMLATGQQFLGSHDYLAVVPGVAIAVAVLGLNLLGDGLRDVMDPRLKQVGDE